MGLDMYLNVKEYVSNWDHNKEKNGNNDRFDNIINAAGIKTKMESPSVTLQYNAIYWRKANQIHGWFVETCGDGVDECQDIPVSRERIIELQSICKQLLDSKSEELAAELLPPTPGFFFGGYNLDEWYWKEIQKTYDQLTKLLDLYGDDVWNYSFIYQASW